MRQKKKTRREILEKKLKDIQRGKWKASEEEVKRIKEQLKTKK